ncbi:MAG TPA: alpha-amylase family glycosyl hydrolase [Chthoniobacterales bacterium]
MRIVLILFVVCGCFSSGRGKESGTELECPPGWWKNAVFYQIFVRSFADSSEGSLANDGIGDLQGLIDRLDYLNDGDPATNTDLGVTALWLLPIHPSPSYHGYDVTDYYGINPQYGDLRLFKHFLAEAHRRGIRVIIDLVLNHCSTEHPWFREALEADSQSPKRSLFRFSPEPLQPSGPWGEPCWRTYKDGYFYGAFADDMVDWNFQSQKVTRHHYEVAKFWLKKIGVDGFRVDAARYFEEDGNKLADTPETKTWLRDFTAYCHSLKPDAFVMGEVWTKSNAVSQYVRGGSLDSAFEFELAYRLLSAARFGLADPLIERLKSSEAAFGGHAWGTFLANHDQDRALSVLDGSVAKARLAAFLQFTVPGIPFIYYGEEIGMSGRKPDPDLRTPMQWTGEPNAGFTAAGVQPWRTVNADFPTVNVTAESANDDSLLALYRRLVRLRGTSPALRSGRDVAFTFQGRGFYAAMRESDTDIVLVLSNLDGRASDQWTLALPPSVQSLGAPNAVFSTEPNVDTSSLALTGTPFSIPARSGLVFQWRKR